MHRKTFFEHIYLYFQNEIGWALARQVVNLSTRQLLNRYNPINPVAF